MKSAKDIFGNRMKSYEVVSRMTLTPRMPVIIRVDGKAFHSYAKAADKPFDESLSSVMVETAKALCKGIQGAQVAYLQSDEISIFINNYKNIKSQSWFANDLQKMVSISAGIASSVFTANSNKIGFNKNAIKPAVFDSRAFVLPEKEVCNYFIWRQKDTIRNSIQSAARSMFSQKQCLNKKSFQLKEMMFENGQNWDSYPDRFKYGICIINKDFMLENSSIIRRKWTADYNIPNFIDNRGYIESFI